MEFFLIKNYIMLGKLVRADAHEISDSVSDTNRDFNSMVLDRVNVNMESCDGNQPIEELISKLASFSKKSDQMFGNLMVELGVLEGQDGLVRNGDGERILGKLSLSPCKNIDQQADHVDVMEKIHNAFGENEVLYDVRMEIANMQTENVSSYEGTILTVHASNLKYCPVKRRIDGDVEFVPAEVINFWNYKKFVYCKVNVILKMDVDAVSYFELMRNTNLAVTSAINCNMECMPSRDVYIKCQNGARVKCEYKILASLSEQLRSEMTVTGDGPIKKCIRMSEDGVKDLVQWACLGLTTRAGENAIVALEILKFAVYYNVPLLVTDMKKLIMSKGTRDFSYFSVEAAIRMYLRSKDDENLHMLRDKAVRILKRYALEDYNKLEQSVEYHRFFRKHPRLAMELSALYIQL